MGDPIEGTNLEERVVLLALSTRERAGETPATAVDIVGTCRDYLDAVEADVVGRVTEAEVSRALHSLAATAIVEEQRENRTATGKGRTRYALGTDASTVFEQLSSDGRLESVIEAQF